MRPRKQPRSHFKQLLRQFYEIHEASLDSFAPSQHSSEAIHDTSHRQQCRATCEEPEAEEKEKMMATCSTEVKDSKVRVWEEEANLNKIEEKSQGESEVEDSGSEGEPEYIFEEKYPSPSSRHLENIDLLEIPQQRLQTRPKIKKSKMKTKPKAKKPASLKDSKSQIFVPLKYEHHNGNKVYHVGMKFLNKQWFNTLDQIHRKV